MGLRGDMGEVLSTTGRFLLFQPVRPDLKRLRWHYLAFGLGCSWLAGLGRYWDTPEAHWWQYAGFGSVIYTLFMAAFLYSTILPLRPDNWSYLNVLTFVGMTAPPAILYAIPVERFTAPETASQVNYVFLLIVAAWRVVLLWLYLRRSARLTVFSTTVGLALPLALILVVLAFFQLTSTIAEGMAGNRGPRQPRNLAGELVILLGRSAFFSLPVIGAAYCYCIAKSDRRWQELQLRDTAKANQSPPPPPTSDCPGEV